MNDTLCLKFDFLRYYLPAELGGTANFEFKQITNFNKYCPSENCNTDLEKITIGFLWLLEQYFTISKDTDDYNENNTNAFFLYIISWLSYQLKQNSEHNTTTINDFYTKHVKNSGKYSKFINDSSICANLKEIIDKQKDLFNIDIEDLSKFYDAFKLLCNIYGNVAKNEKSGTLSNNANNFVEKYTDLNDYYNVENTPHSQILSVLLTDYNKLKTDKSGKIDNSKQFPILPTEKATKPFSRSSRSSSIKISVIPMTFLFFALLIYLGITYKASKTQFKNQKNKEENKSLIYYSDDIN
ncbi:BIR protein [Plasmodium berghei]|uniref:BIR protein n=3 Tax=Plasmodium berghei TaxID=5821 RepID=A0A509B2H1_PLABA|nr:BIR protein [Plasmodium berghei ANKA]SCL84303.1 BIR protein [Plasmodium berghei]SCL86829.1 BIR protein [Plasmodium berghei]VUC58784.1 BIR protein [Plasmodium berghei ANKA]|eukprot:XP_034424507.1 BIR protein [Plasmodium berghei ANKA]